MYIPLGEAVIAFHSGVNMKLFASWVSLSLRIEDDGGFLCFEFSVLERKGKHGPLGNRGWLEENMSNC